MDSNNWRPNQGAEPNMDSSDWRGQLQPESRQRVVNKIMKNEDLSAKAKSKFSISLGGLSQPMSLKEIAKTWDVSARTVISEYAQQSGGGTQL